jgi:excinuclease ABC subunit A
MKIRVRGAAEHNLRGVDVDITDGLTVVTGISGSGKSSLAFDTLYREVHRRFVDVFGRPGEGMRLAPVRVDSITGSGPVVAVGQNLLNRNPASRVATASGIHPFLRLLYARFGERRCPECGTPLAVRSLDEIARAAAEGAARGPVRVVVPLVRGTTGSHRTLLQLLTTSLGRASIRVDGHPLSSRTSLDPAKPHDVEVIVGRIEDGAGKATLARAREVCQQAAWLGAHAVILDILGSRTVLSRTPACPGCGRPFRRLDPAAFHPTCAFCRGQGCPECVERDAVRVGGRTLPELLGLAVDDLEGALVASGLPKPAGRLHLEITRRVAALRAVGLGYVGLDRAVPTLSRGEAQRLRLAVAMTVRLEDMVLILDEPTIGQHPRDVAALVSSFRHLGGPVVFVEHDRTAALLADRAIEIGPEAGSQGGRLVYRGTARGILKGRTHTGDAFSGRRGVLPREPAVRPVPPEPTAWIRLRGASARNLAGIDVDIPVGRLTVVSGVSGSGKSTLVEEVLVPSVHSGRAVGCRSVDTPPLAPVAVDQSPIGVNPRSNPATYTGLADLLRRFYAQTTGLGASHFSFNRGEGACPACEGMGAVEVRMRYLPSTWVRCEECGGRRFRPVVLEAGVRLGNEDLSIADLYERPVSDVAPLLLGCSQGKRFAPLLEALQDVGLGYVPLGQPSPTLSGGEAQRVKLTRYLGRRSLSRVLLTLDEPSTGLHPHDIQGLLAVLRRIVNAGATVVVVEHNTDVIRAADWCIDLGPGAGSAGGRIVAQGDLRHLLAARASATGRALRAESAARTRDAGPAGEKARARAPRPRPFLRIQGARANNLKDVSLSIPKGKLTVVTGLSGSGKSSLVRDVLEAEARRRYLESLSLYERQATREGPEAEVDAVTGLGVTAAVSGRRWGYSLRADVGWATEISRHLAVLFAAEGTRVCTACHAPMERLPGAGGWHCARCGERLSPLRPEHFALGTYSAACTKCHGVGSLQVPAPDRLVIRPDLPLCGGAMYSPGFFPQGYLCKPGNGGYDMVRAVAKRHGWDPCVTPWNSMSPQARHVFLHGDPEPLAVTFRSKNGRTTKRALVYGGFYGFLGDWDVGGTYTTRERCPDCGGARLRPEYAGVRLGGHTLHDLRGHPLVAVAAALESLPTPGDPPASLAAGTALRRLRFLRQVGLDYLHLGRIASTLSAGEAQRVRLASLLGSGLTSLTLLLDEPTRGLHPREVAALTQALLELRDQGNTVIVVEHDLELVRAADHVVELGPGAGAAGGRVVARGTPAQVARGRGPTARWLASPQSAAPEGTRERRKPRGILTVRAPRENNLDGSDVSIPLGVLAGVCGVSGSGKSTLCIDVLARALVPTKITTSVAREPLEPGRHDGIVGAPERTRVVDQATAGISSPWHHLGLEGALAALYARSPAARELGLTADALARGCADCRGEGHVHLDMGFLPAVAVPCDTCSGTGVPLVAAHLEMRGHTLAALGRMELSKVLDLYADEPTVAAPLAAACSMGLGYLALRQSASTLSGGEAQRLRLSRELARGSGDPCFFILDEPTVGQHQDDVLRLAGVLRGLVDRGHSVLVVEHHPLLLAACDWLIELGPGAGPDGGHVVAQGTPETLAHMQTPTAPHLRRILEEPP